MLCLFDVSFVLNGYFLLENPLQIAQLHTLHQAIADNLQAALTNPYRIPANECVHRTRQSRTEIAEYPYHKYATPPNFGVSPI